MKRSLSPCRPSRGLTLLEVLATLTVLAVLVTLALPSFSSLLQRHRLGAAAEALAADLREARFEAVRSGQPLHLQTRQSGAGDWCWTVARQPDCGCSVSDSDNGASCSLKTVRASDHAGITLLQPLRVRLEPQGLAGRAGPASQTGQTGQMASTELASRHGHRLRVELAALGRSRVCVPTPAEPGSAGRYPPC